MKKRLILLLIITNSMLAGCAGQYEIKYSFSIERTDKKEILNQNVAYTTTYGGSVESMK